MGKNWRDNGTLVNLGFFSQNLFSREYFRENGKMLSRTDDYLESPSSWNLFEK